MSPLPQRTSATARRAGATMSRIHPQRIPVDGAYRHASPRAAAQWAGEESKYPPACCAAADCAAPVKPGCGGHCARCWQERRALTQLY